MYTRAPRVTVTHVGTHVDPVLEVKMPIQQLMALRNAIALATTTMGPRRVVRVRRYSLVATVPATPRVPQWAAGTSQAASAYSLAGNASRASA